jgi:hypothetical protein
MVAGHYGALEFSVLEESAAESIWSLKVADVSPRTLPFAVSRPGNF